MVVRFISAIPYIGRLLHYTKIQWARPRVKININKNITQWVLFSFRTIILGGRSFCRTDILSNGHFAERTFCRTDILSNGHFAENLRDIFWTLRARFHYQSFCMWLKSLLTLMTETLKEISRDVFVRTLENHQAYNTMHLVKLWFTTLKIYSFSTIEIWVSCTYHNISVEILCSIDQCLK